jgi:hypothetical protein
MEPNLPTTEHPDTCAHAVLSHTPLPSDNRPTWIPTPHTQISRTSGHAAMHNPSNEDGDCNGQLTTTAMKTTTVMATLQ